MYFVVVGLGFGFSFLLLFFNFFEVSLFWLCGIFGVGMCFNLLYLGYLGCKTWLFMFFSVSEVFGLGVLMSFYFNFCNILLILLLLKLSIFCSLFPKLLPMFSVSFKFFILWSFLSALPYLFVLKSVKQSPQESVVVCVFVMLSLFSIFYSVWGLFTLVLFSINSQLLFLVLILMGDSGLSSVFIIFYSLLLTVLFIENEFVDFVCFMVICGTPLSISFFLKIMLMFYFNNYSVMLLVLSQSSLLFITPMFFAMSQKLSFYKMTLLDPSLFVVVGLLGGAIMCI